MKALLASAGMSPDEFVSQAVEAVYPSDVSSGAYIRNRPVTSFTRGQSIYGNFAASNLADLSFTTACEKFYCKGADGALFLTAMSSEFLEAGVSVIDFEISRNATIGAAWASTKAALAGATEESQPTIGEAWKDASKFYGSTRRLSNALSDARDGLIEGARDAMNQVPGVHIDSQGNVSFDGGEFFGTDDTMWDPDGNYSSWTDRVTSGIDGSGPAYEALVAAAEKSSETSPMSTDEIQTWLLESPMNIDNLED